MTPLCNIEAQELNNGNYAVKFYVHMLRVAQKGKGNTSMYTMTFGKLFLILGFVSASAIASNSTNNCEPIYLPISFKEFDNETLLPESSSKTSVIDYTMISDFDENEDTYEIRFEESIEQRQRFYNFFSKLSGKNIDNYIEKVLNGESIFESIKVPGRDYAYSLLDIAYMKNANKQTINTLIVDGYDVVDDTIVFILLRSENVAEDLYRVHQTGVDLDTKVFKLQLSPGDIKKHSISNYLLRKNKINELRDLTVNKKILSESSFYLGDLINLNNQDTSILEFLNQSINVSEYQKKYSEQVSEMNKAAEKALAKENSIISPYSHYNIVKTCSTSDKILDDSVLFAANDTEIKNSIEDFRRLYEDLKSDRRMYEKLSKSNNSRILSDVLIKIAEDTNFFNTEEAKNQIDGISSSEVLIKESKIFVYSANEQYKSFRTGVSLADPETKRLLNTMKLQDVFNVLNSSVNISAQDVLIIANHTSEKFEYGKNLAFLTMFEMYDLEIIQTLLENNIRPVNKIGLSFTDRLVIDYYIARRKNQYYKNLKEFGVISEPSVEVLTLISSYGLPVPSFIETSN